MVGFDYVFLVERQAINSAFVGVDACNTALEVLIFAAATNLGQSWTTVLTLFGCMFVA
jgi:hypothetical protein